MPRTPLDLRLSVDHLSILDGDGNLDTALEPDIAAGDLKRMYRTMVLGRRLDERMVRLQRQGRIGTFAPIKGQEASQIGAVATLRREDWMVPSFRETAAMLWRGWPIEQLLAFFAGRASSSPRPSRGPSSFSDPSRTRFLAALAVMAACSLGGSSSKCFVCTCLTTASGRVYDLSQCGHEWINCKCLLLKCRSQSSCLLNFDSHSGHWCFLDGPASLSLDWSGSLDICCGSVDEPLGSANERRKASSSSAVMAARVLIRDRPPVDTGLPLHSSLH